MRAGDGTGDRLPEALRLEGGGVVSLVGAGGKTSLMYRLARELAGAGQSVLTTTTTHIYPPSADQCAVCILAPTAGQILEHAEIVSSVDTGGVPPTSHPIPVSNVMREDEARPSLPREDVLANAPDQKTRSEARSAVRSCR